MFLNGDTFLVFLHYNVFYCKDVHLKMIADWYLGVNHDTFCVGNSVQMVWSGNDRIQILRGFFTDATH